MAALGHGRRPDVSLDVGVDIGGTWIRAIAIAGDRPVARFTHRLEGELDLPGLLRAAWRRRRWSAARVGALVVASRGVWTPAECRRLGRRFRGLAARVRVIPDAHAALLGALGLEAGVLVLAGTGSIVLGRDGRGRWARAGGLGPLLGDEGSGFWLGREWLRALAGGHAIGPVRRWAVGPDAVARIAALAPAVLARARTGDPRARRVVRAGQACLATQARHVVRQLGLRSPVAMSWAGSVMSDAAYRAGVARALRRHGIQGRWRAPATTPVVAAARLAQELSTFGRGRGTRSVAAAVRRR
jgi:N-acetylglucosamine kinase-like BadF-type ATPase